MAISLKKGQGVSLRKEDNDLTQVTIGLGWDCEEPGEKRYEWVERKRTRKRKGVMGKVLSKIFGPAKVVNESVRVPIEWDLDVCAFLCNAAGKVAYVGDTKDDTPTLFNGDVIFFKNMKHRSGQIWLTGDNRNGDGDGDDEQIIANLNAMPIEVHKIVFVVQIYRGKAKLQNFSGVKNAFIRAVDNKGKEMARFDLSGGGPFATHRSIIFAELVRETGGWKLNAIAEPFETDSFADILRERYLDSLATP